MNQEVKNRVRELAKEISLILGDLPDPQVKKYEHDDQSKFSWSETFVIEANGLRLFVMATQEKKGDA